MLREGLTNYDTMADLWKRLDTIPQDLGDFFKHILNSVEPFYHQKMAGTLQIALAAQKPLPVSVYAFHDQEYDDEKYSINEPFRLGPERRWTNLRPPFTEAQLDAKDCSRSTWAAWTFSTAL